MYINRGWVGKKFMWINLIWWKKILENESLMENEYILGSLSIDGISLVLVWVIVLLRSIVEINIKNK